MIKTPPEKTTALYERSVLIYGIERIVLVPKFYIGQSVNPVHRITQHVNDQSSADELAADIARYGLGAFLVHFLEFVTPSIALDREEHWIEIYQALEPNGYNKVISKGSSPLSGGKPDDWIMNTMSPGDKLPLSVVYHRSRLKHEGMDASAWVLTKELGYSTAQAADILRVSPQNIPKMIRRHVELIGRR